MRLTMSRGLVPLVLMMIVVKDPALFCEHGSLGSDVGRAAAEPSCS